MPGRTLKPATLDRVYRGQKFHFVEVDIDEYDEIIRKATNKVESPITGRDEDVTDEALAVRMLLRKSLVSPVIKDWNLGTRLIRQLERDVRELHFGTEPAETTGKAADESTDVEDEAPNAAS
jgi:hypothetical protein